MNKMSIWQRYAVIALVALLATGAAYTYWRYQRENSSLADAAQVRMTVTSFGDQLRKIPVLADPELVGKGMDMFYGLYVHPNLLATWKADLQNAPGRLTSSPWPDRIDIENVKKNSDGTFTVDANVVEMANSATSTVIADRIAIRMVLTKGPDGWQITSYQKR